MKKGSQIFRSFLLPTLLLSLLCSLLAPLNCQGIIQERDTYFVQQVSAEKYKYGNVDVDLPFPALHFEVQQVVATGDQSVLFLTKQNDIQSHDSMGQETQQLPLSMGFFEMGGQIKVVNLEPFLPSLKPSAIRSSSSQILALPTISSRSAKFQQSITVSKLDHMIDLILATDGGIYQCNYLNLTAIEWEISGITFPCIFIQQKNLSDITSLSILNDNESERQLFIGSKNGLYSMTLIKGGMTHDTSILVKSFVKLIADSISCVATNYELQLVAAGSNVGLYLLDVKANNMRVEWIPGPIDSTPTSLQFIYHPIAHDSKMLWIGTERSIVVLHLMNYTYDRISSIYDLMPSEFYGYLPYTNITGIQLEPISGDVWIGSTMGAIRYEASRRRWKYLFGHRWIVGNHVQQMAVTMSIQPSKPSSLASYNVWIATDQGLARIALDGTFTLHQKADLSQDIMYPRHDRYGLVAECGLKQYGNLSSWFAHDSDNNGLWTSVYLASQVYKYKALSFPDPDTKKIILKHFDAIAKLNTISGTPGFIARSYAKINDTVQSPEKWANSTVFPGWKYKRDTSTDEIDAHFYILNLIVQLFDKSSGEIDIELNGIANQAKQFILNVTDYILDNNYYYIDPVTHKPTTWGFWHWEQLNQNPMRYQERHANSLGIVTYLLSAYQHSNRKDKYLKAIYDLIERHQYGANILNMKMLKPDEWNFSDDELIYHNFLTYFQSYFALTERNDSENINDPYYVSIIRSSLKTMWMRLKRFGQPMWTFATLYCMSENKTRGSINKYFSSDDLSEWLHNAINSLRDWPVDFISWPMINSARTDILISTSTNTVTSPPGYPLLSFDEIGFPRYNANPVRTSSGNGYAEADSAVYLWPYWMARYYGFISS